jgi:glycogen operon protein
LDGPPWHDGDARLLAFTLAGVGDGESPLHAIFNMSDTARSVTVPSLAGYRWHRAVDTALPSL